MSRKRNSRERPTSTAVVRETEDGGRETEEAIAEGGVEASRINHCSLLMRSPRAVWRLVVVAVVVVECHLEKAESQANELAGGAPSSVGVLVELGPHLED